MGFLIWLPVVSVVKALFILKTRGGGWGKKTKNKSHLYVSFANDQTACVNKNNKKTWNADDFFKRCPFYQILLVITCESRFLNSWIWFSCSILAARSCFSRFSMSRSWSRTRLSFSALCCCNRCVFSCSCSSFSSTIWLDNEEDSSSTEHPCRHDNSWIA